MWFRAGCFPDQYAAKAMDHAGFPFCMVGGQAGGRLVGYPTGGS